MRPAVAEAESALAVATADDPSAVPVSTSSLLYTCVGGVSEPNDDALVVALVSGLCRCLEEGEPPEQPPPPPHPTTERTTTAAAVIGEDGDSEEGAAPPMPPPGFYRTMKAISLGLELARQPAALCFRARAAEALGPALTLLEDKLAPGVSAAAGWAPCAPSSLSLGGQPASQRSLPCGMVAVFGL
jgi:hypothetical protein